MPKILFAPTEGVNNDLPPTEVGPRFYTDAVNFHFRDRFALRTRGQEQVYTGTQAEVRQLLNTQIGGQNFWLYFGIDTVYVVETSNHTNISPAGLSIVDDPNRWTVGELNGVPVANNGVDPPIFWDGNTANPMQELTGWPAGQTCEVIRPHRFHLFALNYTNADGAFPEGVAWSDAAEPGAIPQTWSAAADNEAGDASLASTEGAIVDGWNLRESLAIYKQSSAFLADYIGGNFVFEFRPMLRTTGVLSRNCIADVKGQHMLVTDGDVVITDGNTTQSVIDDRMRRWLFNQLDEQNFEATFVANYVDRDEVWICFPSAGNFFCDLALVISTTTGALGVRQLPMISCAESGPVNDVVQSNVWDDQNIVWDSFNSLWNQQQSRSVVDSLVMGFSDDTTPTNSAFFEVDAGSDFDGTPISATVVKEGMDLGDANRFKLVQRIYPKIDAQPGTEVQIRIGTQRFSEDSISYNDSQTFIVGETEYLEALALGRYFGIRAGSLGGEPWTFVGFELEFEFDGAF